MKIVTLGDPLLRRHSVLVSDIDRGIKDFVEAMAETMDREEGLGLSAVQVGHLLRMFVTHIRGDRLRVFINPDIVETSIELAKYDEGCLSIPGVTAEVVRPAVVEVQAWNEKGRPFRLRAVDLLARVVQHELDHLNGKLFIDYLDPKKRERIIKQYEKKVTV
jgi:peptide deformylase